MLKVNTSTLKTNAPIVDIHLQPHLHLQTLKVGWQLLTMHCKTTLACPPYPGFDWKDQAGNSLVTSTVQTVNYKFLFDS